VSGIEDLLRDAYQEAARSVRPEHVRPAVVLPRAGDQRRSAANPAVSAARARRNPRFVISGIAFGLAPGS